MAKLRFTLEDLTDGCRRLKENQRFAPGFDKMTPGAAEIWLKINGERLCNQLNSGKYHVMPAMGFSVAKKDGKFRRLVRLTALDSIIQYAATEQLLPFCAEHFSQFSYAYQKGKSIGNALDQYCKYAFE